MKTQPASLPSPLPSADMLLSDEVVFRHKDTDGNDAQVRAPLALGLLYAANALRAGETFALGYPDDPVGRIVRSDGGRIVVQGDAASTFSAMVAFLDRYTEAVVTQVRRDVAEANTRGSGPTEGSAPLQEDGDRTHIENISLPAA